MDKRKEIEIDNTMTKQNKAMADLRMSDLSPDERERLVTVFAWLIKEGRKQYPELFKKKSRRAKA